MDERPGNLVNDVARSAAAGAGRAIGTLAAAALVCGVIGGVGGLALWLGVWFILDS